MGGTIHQPRRIGEPHEPDKHLRHVRIVPSLIPSQSRDDTGQDEAQDDFQGHKVSESGWVQRQVNYHDCWQVATHIADKLQ